jgi:hypothetical protein
MKAITTILLISILNGSPYQTIPVQSDTTVLVSSEEVKKKKKKKGKKIQKGKKKKKGFFSKVFGSK